MSVIINIYWHDLSAEGKATLINAGFTPSEDEEEERVEIGAIATGYNDTALERLLPE